MFDLVLPSVVYFDGAHDYWTNMANKKSRKKQAAAIVLALAPKICEACPSVSCHT
jgi:hypothetical protein